MAFKMAPKSPALKATGMFTGNPNNTPPVESSLAGAPNYEKPVFKKEETKKKKTPKKKKVEKKETKDKK